MNGAGRVLCRGRAEGAGADELSDEGLWAGTPGDVRLVVAEGQAAPGTGGARFSQALATGPHGLEWQPAFISVEQNDAGQVAWLGSLSGADVTEANGTAIFATDPGGEILLVAREGDELDVSGTLRRIDRLAGWLAFSVDDPDSDSWFNNAAELAFAATFTDGSQGVFVAVVPEPALAGVVAGAMLLLARRRRGSNG